VLETIGAEVPESGLRTYVALAREVGRQALHLARPATFEERDHDRRHALREGALAASRLADRHYFADNAIAMMTSSILAVNLAERSGLQAKVARPYTQIAYLAGLARLRPLVARYLRRARETARDTDDPGGLAQAQWVESLHHVGFAEWAEAETIAHRALALARAMDDGQEIETVLTILGHIEHYTGRFAEAEARYIAVSESAKKRANRQHEAWGAYARARSLLSVGRFELAASLLAEAMTLLEDQHDFASKSICHGLAATLHLSRGDRERARLAAEQAFAMVTKSPPSVYSTLPAYAGVVDFALDRWERERSSAAASQARASIALLGRFAQIFPLGAPTFDIVRGRAAAIAGHAREARRRFEVGAARARASGMPFEEAVATLELAKLDRAPAKAEAARVAFERLGCAFWRAQAEVVAASV
jgi:hypothetical protein